MSEVRGKCDFCVHADTERVRKACIKCVNCADRPDWRPSWAGNIALRMEADTARLDALERIIAERAARGETVELDGRTPGLLLLSYWRPEDDCLDHESTGGNLRGAIDAAREQGGADGENETE